jgi:hypothetical protein
MPEKAIIPILLLIARPGAGKSEIIHYLEQLPIEKRAEIYHIGKLRSIDDFPFLWRWFEEDDILEKMGEKRLYTDAEGYFKANYLWDLLIHLINLDHLKLTKSGELTPQTTILIEFSRGKEHGGYKHALPLLSDEILEKLAILYVNVSWQESLRKNRKRFNPDKPDSILEHSLPDNKLERLYRDCDFHEIASNPQGWLPVREYQVPYAVFENEDDVTTAMGEDLGHRLKAVLNTLWETAREKKR